MFAKEFFSLALCLYGIQALCVTQDAILTDNARATVYLEVVDQDGSVLDRGSGFIVSSDGFVVTVAHLQVDANQKLWAVIGQRQGTRYSLSRRESNEDADVAIWQLPQSSDCKNAAVISAKSVKVLDRALVLGFPGLDGLSPSSVTIKNLNSAQGFFKTDGFLEPGNSGGPVFNEDGLVIAIVQGGGLPGTENNEVVPIALAVDLLKKRGVQFGLGEAIPLAESCFAKCRHESHGLEKWTVDKPWAKDSGWVPGGHNGPDECDKLMAASLVNNADAEIVLSPGNNGTREESKKDLLGKVEYRYFCAGRFLDGPIYVEKRTSACGVWR